jgi:RNA exonuclease 4
MFSKGGKRRPKALKQLALQELGLAIQDGQHSSVDDARAALYLYLKHAGECSTQELHQASTVKS